MRFWTGIKADGIETVRGQKAESATDYTSGGLPNGLATAIQISGLRSRFTGRRPVPQAVAPCQRARLKNQSIPCPATEFD